MLEEYMINIGYSDEQRELITNSYPLNTYTESTLLFNVKNIIYSFFHILYLLLLTVVCHLEMYIF